MDLQFGMGIARAIYRQTLNGFTGGCEGVVFRGRDGGAAGGGVGPLFPAYSAIHGNASRE